MFLHVYAFTIAPPFLAPPDASLMGRVLASAADAACGPNSQGARGAGALRAPFGGLEVLHEEPRTA